MRQKKEAQGPIPVVHGVLHHGHGTVGVEGSVVEDAILPGAGVVEGEDHRRLAGGYVDVAGDQVAYIDRIEALGLEQGQVSAEVGGGAGPLCFFGAEMVVHEHEEPAHLVGADGLRPFRGHGLGDGGRVGRRIGGGGLGVVGGPGRQSGRAFTRTTAEREPAYQADEGADREGENDEPEDLISPHIAESLAEGSGKLSGPWLKPIPPGVPVIPGLSGGAEAQESAWPSSLS